MQERKNACLQAVMGDLRQAGIDFQVERGSKHLQVRFELNGITRCAWSP